MSLIYLKPSYRVMARQTVEGFARDNRKNRTTSEEKFCYILNELGYDYEFQKVFNVAKKGKKPKFKIVDFYLYRLFIVIEIDGGYHNTLRQKRRDFTRESAMLNKPGIKAVIRFTDVEVETMPLDKIKQRIESYIY